MPNIVERVTLAIWRSEGRAMSRSRRAKSGGSFTVLMLKLVIYMVAVGFLTVFLAHQF
jgi:hypothetical protein